MKIIFVGSQEIGEACLNTLLKLDHEIMLIISEPLASHEKIKNEVMLLAENQNIPFLEVKDIHKDEVRNRIKKISPDLIVVCGWRKVIKPEILDIPKKGSIALHSSLLPRYRGFAPMTWPIINGEKETGITMIYMAEGIDNGDIIGQIKYKIGLKDTGYDIYKKAIDGATKLLVKYIPLIEVGKEPRKKQREENASFATARVPDQGIIDWTKNAKDIYNLIRALTKPYPGAFTYHKGKKLFIWEAEILPHPPRFYGSPGQIVRVGIIGVWVLTGKGILRLKRVQLGDQDEMAAEDYFKSVKTKLGYNVIEEIEKMKEIIRGRTKSN